MEAGLAQLAARESHNLKVVGSSPTSRKSFAFLCNFLACRGRAFYSPLQLFCMSRARAREALRFASVPSAFCLWAEEGEVPAEGVAFPHATSPPYSSAPTTCEWIEFGSTSI